MNQDSDHEKIIRQEFQALRDSLKTVQLATIDSDGNPQASYAPCVWIENDCYLYLSELARHTQNLIANPAISLLLIESEDKSKNLFSRRRIILQGEVSTIGRDTNRFVTIMAEFKSRFGDFIEVIEPQPERCRLPQPGRAPGRRPACAAPRGAMAVTRAR